MFNCVQLLFKMADSLPEMQYRFLGRTGLKVSVISLGSWLTYGGHVGNGLHIPCPWPGNGSFIDDLQRLHLNA